MAPRVQKEAPPSKVREDLKSARTSGRTEGRGTKIPAWASDARWYQVVVGRFHNGDRSNDPAGTLPWATDSPPGGDTDAADRDKPDARRYGGDLQGLQKRLAYLKTLSVNALYLTSIFHVGTGDKQDAVDLRHVDDTLGVKDGLARVNGETLDPKSWKFSASDRVFLGFLKEAHKQNVRVVVEASFGRARKTLPEGVDAQKHLFETTRRWMDPNGDRKPSDGIDGWVLREPGKMPHEFWKRWRKHAKSINPDALLIGDIHADPTSWLTGDEFDTAINRDLAKAVERFFGPRGDNYGLGDFLADLTRISSHHNHDIQLAAPVPLSSPEMGRLLSALSLRRRTEEGKGTEATLVADLQAGRPRWRLASVIQYFFVGAPMIYYGDEVGVYNTKGHFSRAPMWWNNPDDKQQSKPAAYRDDFASLIQWLNIRRGIDPLLRQGAFRTVLLDEERRILAFARLLQGEKVILLMNYGDKKQKVMLPAGKPGQLIAVVSPILNPGARSMGGGKSGGPAGQTQIKRLRTGGSKQFVDAGGRVRLWVNPMSFRVVLVSEKEP